MWNFIGSTKRAPWRGFKRIFVKCEVWEKSVFAGDLSKWKWNEKYFECWLWYFRADDNRDTANLAFCLKWSATAVNLLRRWVEMVQLPFRNRYVFFQRNKISLFYLNWNLPGPNGLKAQINTANSEVFRIRMSKAVLTKQPVSQLH